MCVNVIAYAMQSCKALCRQRCHGGAGLGGVCAGRARGASRCELWRLGPGLSACSLACSRTQGYQAINKLQCRMHAYETCPNLVHMLRRRSPVRCLFFASAQSSDIFRRSQECGQIMGQFSSLGVASPCSMNAILEAPIRCGPSPLQTFSKCLGSLQAHEKHYHSWCPAFYSPKNATDDKFYRVPSKFVVILMCAITTVSGVCSCLKHSGSTASPPVLELFTRYLGQFSWPRPARSY